MTNKHLVALFFTLAALSICAPAHGQVLGNNVSRGITSPSIGVGYGASSNLESYGSSVIERSYSRNSANPLAARDITLSSGISKNSRSARINALLNTRRNSSRISAFLGRTNPASYNPPINNRPIAASRHQGGVPAMLESATTGRANPASYNLSPDNRRIAADQQLSRIPPMLAPVHNEFSVNTNNLGQIPKSFYPGLLTSRKGLGSLGTLSDRKSLSSYRPRQSLSGRSSLLTKNRLNTARKAVKWDILPKTSWQSWQQ